MWKDFKKKNNNSLSFKKKININTVDHMKQNDSY